jgi:hypothetical protein
MCINTQNSHIENKYNQLSVGQLRNMSITYQQFIIFLVLPCVMAMLSFSALGHGVDEETKHFVVNTMGVQLVPFLYIGAEHMITGYDHLLFLFGVIFFLRKSKDILIYVSLFTLGHSITLLIGVLSHIQVNAYLIDAIIGLSVVYKGFDNLSGFKHFLGFSPDPKTAVFVFGLCHGLGLATKLQDFQLKAEGLIENLLAFNLGVEIGQFLALGLLLLLLNILRQHSRFNQFIVLANTTLMCCGFMLIGFQLTGYVVNL